MNIMFLKKFFDQRSGNGEIIPFPVYNIPFPVSKIISETSTHLLPNIQKSRQFEEKQKDGGQNAPALPNPNGPFGAFHKPQSFCTSTAHHPGDDHALLHVKEEHGPVGVPTPLSSFITPLRLSIF